MRQAAHFGYRVLAGLFLAGAVLQFFLAGLGVFGAASFEVHATVGTILGLASIVLFVLAAILAVSGDLAWRWAGLAALLVVLMAVQWSLVEVFSEAVPTLAALHPVNGLLVLAVALSLALGRRLPLPTGRASRRQS